MQRSGIAIDDDDEADDDEEDLLQGLTRPKLNAMPAGDDDDDDDDETPSAPKPGASAEERAAEDVDEEEEEEEEAVGGLVGAEAAFALQTAPDALELDPFRVAAGAHVADVSDQQSSSTSRAAAPKGGAAIPRQIFVRGLPHSVDDAALVKFFVRYGKVQEANVVKGGGGTSRGFGFVTFVNDKGARFCLKEAGDPPSVAIGGRDCTVRYAEAKDDHGARQHKMPARGNVDYLGLGAKKRSNAGHAGSSSSSARDDELAAPGVAQIAAAHKRGMPPATAPGATDAKRSKKNQEEKGIVTVSRRQDAEPLNKQPITMREIFPKEFWRI